eukprot:Skav201535  [mRNA]  locus=scaffold1616:86162:91948:+ [translate_table: standard]
MTVHGGFLSFLARSRRKFEEATLGAGNKAQADSAGSEGWQAQEDPCETATSSEQFDPIDNDHDNTIEENETSEPVAEERALSDEEIDAPAPEEKGASEPVAEASEPVAEERALSDEEIDAPAPEEKEASEPVAEERALSDEEIDAPAPEETSEPVGNVGRSFDKVVDSSAEVLRPLEAPLLVDELTPLAEPLEEPLEEDSDLETPDRDVNVKAHLARRRKHLEAQLFATGRRRSKADGRSKHVKAEPVPLKKEMKREAAELAFARSELSQGAFADGQEPEASTLFGGSPGKSLLKRRRKGQAEDDGRCESESPAKRGRVMSGLPRTDLLRMAGSLERRYLCSGSLAVTA